MIKEDYLTEMNYTSKISKWQNILQNIKSTIPFLFNAKKSALIVLDMQDYFLSSSSHAYIPSSVFITQKILKLILIYRKFSLPIIFTRHIDDITQNLNMRLWWHDQIRKEDQSSQISQLFGTSSSKIIVKSKYSAFQDTDLNLILKTQNITQLVITGVMTHLCCETTARDAFMKDYELFFLIDGTATYNEELHIGSLRSLQHGFSVCLTVQDIIDSVEHQCNEKL